MANDDLNAADELDTFIEHYRRNPSTAPTSHDTAFAADLLDAADSIQPNAIFLTRLEAQMQVQPTISSSPNGHTRKDTKMLTQKYAPNIPWTLAATLAVVLLSTTILIGLSIWPPVVPSSLAATTATPVPAAEKTLPIAVGGYVSDFSETVLQQMRDAGLTWIAADLPFYTVSNSSINNSLNTLQTIAQSLITTAHDKGLRIMLRIRGSASDMIGNSDSYNREYGQFAAYVASLKADAIQIWDSQNLDLFWRMDDLNPAAYIDLLHEAYVAIKTANPDVMVIMGAPAPTGGQSAFPGKIINDDVYYQGMAEAYTALGEPAADCIGMSYVEGRVAPDQTTGDSRDNYPTRYFPTMLHRAYEPFRSTGLPLCITELAYFSKEGIDGFNDPAYQWASETTAENQADWTAGAIKIAAEMSSIRIPMVMIWRINGMPLNPFTSGYAIIRPDGSCLACDRIADLKQ